LRRLDQKVKQHQQSGRQGVFIVIDALNNVGILAAPVHASPSQVLLVFEQAGIGVKPSGKLPCAMFYSRRHHPPDEDGDTCTEGLKVDKVTSRVPRGFWITSAETGFPSLGKIVSATGVVAGTLVILDHIFFDRVPQEFVVQEEFMQGGKLFFGDWHH
jgi:hypothetical protein